MISEEVSDDLVGEMIVLVDEHIWYRYFCYLLHHHSVLIVASILNCDPILIND